MRFLAIAVVLLSGPTVSRGIGEFEKQIEAAMAIEDKVALAEEGFRAIEGFVPRELFMSYWSIDALGEIASFYQSILESKGIEGLVSDYSNISRICRMEMGDYRYFFGPLKTELDALLATAHESSDKLSIFVQEMRAIQKDALSFWSEESIHSLIEFWILSGQGEKLSDIDALLQQQWSESDIEYWDILLSQIHLSPIQIINAMKEKLLVIHDSPYRISDYLGGSADYKDPFWSGPEIAQNLSEVSTGGPRLEPSKSTQ